MRYRWVWRRVRVLLFVVVSLSLGLRLLRGNVSPSWDGWPVVRYGVGIAIVAGVVVYGLTIWLRRR